MNAVEPPARQEEIARYLDGVRAALLDLPPEVREELLEDLLAHLTEVAAESSEPLVDRLGEPSAYAAELRASAGVEAAATGNTSRSLLGHMLINRVRLWARAADQRVGRFLGYDRARDFLVLLAPGWWVLRGYLVGMILLSLVEGNQGLLPSIGGNAIFGLVIVAIPVALSVKLGAIPTGWPELARYGAYGVSAILGFVLLVNLASIQSRFEDTVYSTQEWNPFSGVRDVYPYDSNGQPLTRVRLFDQDGNPIKMGYRYCSQPDDQTFDPTADYTYPRCAPAPYPRPRTSPSGPQPSGSGAASPSGSISPSVTPAPTPAPSGSVSPSGSPAAAGSPSPTK